jgi:hypothetical protein
MAHWTPEAEKAENTRKIAIRSRLEILQVDGIFGT